MEEINQTSPISPSDRPTLFITMLNATEEELYQLQKAFENTDIQEKYRPIVSNKVIQAMGEYELHQLAHEAHVELESDLSIERVKSIRYSLAYLEKAVNGLIDSMGTANENIGFIANHINHPSGYLATRISDGLGDAKIAMDKAKNYTPKEGMKW